MGFNDIVMREIAAINKALEEFLDTKIDYPLQQRENVFHSLRLLLFEKFDSQAVNVELNHFLRFFVPKYRLQVILVTVIIDCQAF